MKPQLVVALDVASAQDALDLARKLRGEVTWLKVGLELYLAAGHAVVATLREMGFAVFVDLKFLDIPNTVAGAVRQALRCGADMLTIHATGGKAMVQAAVEARDRTNPAARIVAVTVLTHLQAEDMPWSAMSLDHLACTLAQQARNWGADGVVCSGLEARGIRAATAPDFLLVTPGLRREEDPSTDQKRVCTPLEAARAGSDFLVMGRPILAAADPVATTREILRTLEEEA